MQPDEWMAQFQERITALEQENNRLRIELQVCQRSLASQAGVAELECANALLQAELAEEAQQAAITREREQIATERAAELAKANEALARMSSRLADKPDLAVFLGHIMLEAVAQVGADGGHLTTYDKQRDVISTAVLVKNGDLVQSLSFPPEIPAGQVGFIQLIRETRKLRYFDLESNFEQDGYLLWTDVGKYHKQQKHLTGIAIPLYGGSEFLGHFGLEFTNKKLISEQGSELLQALAHQAALAIQLTRLAEEAKQAAVAKEQEKAVQERVAELAKANAVLKRTLDVLATKPELEAFLGQALVAITEQLGAPLSTLWFYDVQDVAHLHMVYQDGQAKLATQSGFPEAVRSHRIQRDTVKWQTLFKERRPYIIDVASDPALEPQAREYILSQGMKMMVTFPLVLGNDLIGFFSIRLLEKRQFQPEELELVQALAQQATLAIQLTRLAEQTKETAVLQERERAERSAQLSRMNDVLQAEVIERQRAERLARGQLEMLVKTLTVLADEPVLNNFLGYVLQAIADQLGDRSGGLYLYSEEHGTTLLHLNYEDGQIQRGAQITRPPALIYPPPKQWDTLYLPQLRQNQILFHDEQELAESFAYVPYREDNEKRGIKTILVVPLLFGETFLGYTFLRTTGCGFCSLGEFVWKPLDTWHSIDSS